MLILVVNHILEYYNSVFKFQFQMDDTHCEKFDDKVDKSLFNHHYNTNSNFKSHLLVRPIPRTYKSLHLNGYSNSSSEAKTYHLQASTSTSNAYYQENEFTRNLNDYIGNRLNNNSITQTKRIEKSDPLLQKIPTNKRKRVRGPKCWEFLLRLLMDPLSNPSLIRWENKDNGIFRLVKPTVVAQRWGKRTGKHSNESLTYDNFARGLRYHYATGALKAVSEKSFVYKFGPKAENALKGLEEIPKLKTDYNTLQDSENSVEATVV